MYSSTAASPSSFVVERFQVLFGNSARTSAPGKGCPADRTVMTALGWTVFLDCRGDGEADFGVIDDLVFGQLAAEFATFHAE